MSKLPKILLIGDSLTHYGFLATFDNIGWIILLNNLYLNKADVLVRTKGGHTSKSLLPYIDNCIGEEQIDLVIYMIGTNDATIEPKTKHVPLSEYIENVKTTVECFKKKNIKDILLITPPPLNDKLWNMLSSMNILAKPDIKLLDITKQYAMASKDIAKELGVHVIDLWKDNTFMAIDLFWDGLHLSKRGNELLYKNIINYIDTNIQHLSASKLVSKIPDL